MSLTGLCQVCEAEADHTCDLCGAVVCDEHYRAEMGACVECAQRVESGPGDGTPP